MEKYLISAPSRYDKNWSHFQICLNGSCSFILFVLDACDVVPPTKQWTVLYCYFISFSRLPDLRNWMKRFPLAACMHTAFVFVASTQASTLYTLYTCIWLMAHLKLPPPFVLFFLFFYNYGHLTFDFAPLLPYWVLFNIDNMNNGFLFVHWNMAIVVDLLHVLKQDVNEWRFVIEFEFWRMWYLLYWSQT